jgi:hypothetical protein
MLGGGSLCKFFDDGLMDAENPALIRPFLFGALSRVALAVRILGFASGLVSKSP